MILGDGDRTVLECLERARPIEPRRRDEAVDGPSNNVFEQGSTFFDPCSRSGTRETEEFALAGGHEARAHAIEGAAMLGLVAMAEAVEEYFAPAIRPFTKPRGKGRASNDRGVTPTDRNDQQ